VVAASEHVQSLTRQVLLEHVVHAACIEILMTPRRPAVESWKVSLALAARRIFVVRPTLGTLAGIHTSVPLQEEGGILPGAVITLQPSPVDLRKLQNRRTQRLSTSDPHGIGQGALGNAGDVVSGRSMQLAAAIRGGLNHSEKHFLLGEDR